MTNVVDASLYAGRGVRSSPIANGENSGEGERDAMPKKICLDVWKISTREASSGGMKNDLGGDDIYCPIYFTTPHRLRTVLQETLITPC